MAPPTVQDPIVAIGAIEDAIVEADVADEIRDLVLEICTKARKLMWRIQRAGMGSQSAYAATATVANYLPEALDQYLRIPRDWAHSNPIHNDGRTSADMMLALLRWLDKGLQQISDRMSLSAASALSIQTSFVEEKISSLPEIDFSVPRLATAPESRRVNRSIVTLIVAVLVTFGSSLFLVSSCSSPSERTPTTSSVSIQEQLP